MATVAGTYGGKLRRRWKAAWKLQTEKGRRNFYRTLLIGAAGLPVLMLLLIHVAQGLDASGALAWEPEFLRNLEKSRIFSFTLGVFLQTLGTDITLWIVLILAGAIAIWAARPMTAIAFPIAWVGADLVVRLGWATWSRSRPDVILGGLAAPGFLHAFPSGHTAKTICLWGLLIYLWIRTSESWIERIVAAGIFAFIAIVVPFGRMRMGAHWPTDVAAGGILGLYWLTVLILALRKERSSHEIREHLELPDTLPPEKMTSA